VRTLEELMSQRFDVFCREDQPLIRWVGTGESFEDVGKIIRADAESTCTPEDGYVVVQSAFGIAEAVGPLFERPVKLRNS